MSSKTKMRSPETGALVQPVRPSPRSIAKQLADASVSARGPGMGWFEINPDAAQFVDECVEFIKEGKAISARQMWDVLRSEYGMTGGIAIVDHYIRCKHGALGKLYGARRKG